MFQQLVLSLFVVCQINGLQTNPSVIIVGAGPAGIAAATQLLENSITNITVLEAENRIGGRIFSVEFGGGYVDIGAQYCHGEKGNVVFEAVKDLNLLEHTHIVNSETNKIYYSDGSIIERELSSDLILSLDNYVDGLNTTAGVSLGVAFLNKYNSTILKKYSGDVKKLAIATDAIKFLHDTILMHEGAFSWDRPAAGRHYKACEGDQGLTWKTRGYHIILDVLMKSYPDPSKKLPIDDKIHLNKTVKQITWNGDKVQVETSDNTQLTADYVIFTPSIGVLKYQRNSLFEPSLPPRKLEAIEAIGFDGVMKIILHFPNKWWKDEDGHFMFVWGKEDLRHLKEDFPEGPEKDGVPWISQITGLIAVPGNPNVLIGWLSGDISPEVEEISEEVLMAGSMYTIKRFLGRNYNISDADKIIRSKWITNPHFRGTYSFEKVEYFKEDVSYQEILAEPLLRNEKHPAVLFAGEATHPTVYSTAHGAIATGQREAQRIINLHKE